MSRMRRMLRDRPKTYDESAERVAINRRFFEAVEAIDSGDAPPALICDCARYALELIAQELPEQDANQWIYKWQLIEALSAALKIAETTVPDGESFYFLLDWEPPSQGPEAPIL